MTHIQMGNRYSGQLNVYKIGGIVAANLFLTSKIKVQKKFSFL